MTDTVPSMGHNVSPNYAEMVSQRLAEDYAEAIHNAEALVEEARGLPPIEPDDDRTLGLHSSMIERMRDSTSRFEKFRVVEKEPHMRAAEATDGFFFGWIEKLARRKKTDKPGVADILQARVNAEMNRRLDEQRRVREEAAAKARAEEARVRREQAEAQRRADEAAAAAARARKAENATAHKLESEAQAARAEQLRAEQAAAAQAYDDARIDTLTKSSDMVRVRPDGSPLVTMRAVPVITLEDASKLDMAAIWPFLKEDHILQAAKQWAKVTNYKKKMDGLVIEMRDEAVIR